MTASRSCRVLLDYTPAARLTPVRRAIGPVLALSPVILALGLWAAGSAAVLHAVLTRGDYVMDEVRRHGLVVVLLQKMAWLAVPYLVLGLACSLAALGLLRLRRRQRNPGLAEGVLGTVLLCCALAATLVHGIAERPALFGGLFYGKGGMRKALQLAIEHHVSPDTFGAAVEAASLAILLLAVGGALRRSRRPGRWAAGLLLGVGACFLVLAWPHPARRPRADHPNVLLVFVDSLREDALDEGSLWEGATPEMRALARSAVRLRGVRTPVARTFPSVATLLTGLHPVQHGVRVTYVSTTECAPVRRSLPRWFASGGYTSAAVSGYCGAPFPDLDFGFSVRRCARSEIDLVTSIAALRGHPWTVVWLRSPWLRRLFPTMREGVECSHPDDVTDEAIATWRAMPEPFFMVAFYDNAHLPYLPVWPDARDTGGYEGPNRYEISAGDLLEQVVAGEASPLQRANATELANAKRLYAGAVRGVDRSLGRLLRSLAEDGLDRRTVVVVLGDHGENLLDAGGPLAHGEAAERDRSYEIPVVVRAPGLLPRVLDDRLGLHDLAPTLLELAGLSLPAGLEGRSFAGRLRGGPSLPERPLVMETDLWWLARDTVDRMDPSGRGLAYPRLEERLLAIEPGDPPHIVVAPKWRQAVLRAKQRRLDFGPWTLTYLPRTTGASLRLYRRDLDPWLTRDLGPSEPARLAEMTTLLYGEMARLGDRHVLEPEDESLRPLATTPYKPARAP